MVMQKKSLGDILVDEGLLSAERLQEAKKVQMSAPGDLGNILVDLEFVKERDVARARAKEIGLQFVDLTRFGVDPEALKAVPEHIVKRHNMLPIKRDTSVTPNRLMVAIGDPKSGKVGLEDIKLVSRCQITPVLAGKADLEDAINRAYSGAPAAPGKANGSRPLNGNGVNGKAGLSAFPAIIKPEEGISAAPALVTNGANPEVSSDLANVIGSDIASIEGSVDEDDDAGEKLSEEAPIIRIAHAIVQQAIREKASDIHIEPGQRSVRIRYRIDGVLNETMTVPKHIQNPLISRFKIMADLNIAERRVPQDGRIPIRADGKDYDLRVSVLPSKFGEKIVMRILDKSSTQVGLGSLGFSTEMRAKLEELASQPNGMLLTTGPTGSGKTTTLYSLLNRVNSVEKNIVTAEDPIEYDLAGITQCQINKKAGLTFAAALRAFLRQDPDIIMVGEMRDLETATIAVESALTGHLVLSTLHTNDAPSAMMRLADMGIESYLIAATVIGVIAQRLCRRICANCKESYQVPAVDLSRFGLKPESEGQMVTLFRGAGCEECRYKGFKGRVGLYELLTMNEETAELVVRRAPVADIREAAKANGMMELREDGLLKVLEGLTTPDEVMRVVFTAGF